MFNLTVRHLALAGLVLSALLGPPGAASSEAATGPPGAATWTDVTKLGARPGADATAAVRLAIEHTPAGGLVFFPPGHYTVSGEIVIDRPLILSGEGLGSQIFQSSPGQSLFVLRGVQGAEHPGSLPRLRRHRRRRQPDQTGGRPPLPRRERDHARRLLRRPLARLHPQHVHRPPERCQYRRLLRRDLDQSLLGVRGAGQRHLGHANTFLAPVLEGGTNGIRLEDAGGEEPLRGRGSNEGLATLGLGPARPGCRR